MLEFDIEFTKFHVDIPFCPGYWSRFNLFWFGPVYVKVRVWASNLFSFASFIYFYRIFESFRIKHLFRINFHFLCSIVNCVVSYLIVACVKYCLVKMSFRIMPFFSYQYLVTKCHFFLFFVIKYIS